VDQSRVLSGNAVDCYAECCCYSFYMLVRQDLLGQLCSFDANYKYDFIAQHCRSSAEVNHLNARYVCALPYGTLMVELIVSLSAG